MNSFTLHAVGNLARNPELCAQGDVAFVRFCLVGEDYVETDTGTKCLVSTVWFHAFDEFAVELRDGAQKGDQLIVEARVSATMRTDKVGEHYCDTTFIVTGFKYGARKGGGGKASAAVRRRPQNPPDGATEERAIAVV